MSNIVPFPDASKKAFPRAPKIAQTIDIHDKSWAGISSLTGKNKRLRDRRQDAWRMANAVTCYWKARLKFEDAVWHVQRVGTAR